MLAGVGRTFVSTWPRLALWSRDRGPETSTRTGSRLRMCSIAGMDDRKLDLDKLIAAARRGAARAPTQVAERISRLVDETPADRLERVMKSPARRMILEGVFWKMPQQLDS